MTKKEKENYKKLVNEAAELIVTLRSWNLHNHNCLLTRDADTGKPIGGWAGDRVSKLVLEARKLGIEGDPKLYYGVGNDKNYR